MGYGLRSIINYVDKLIVFDTGSQDKTVEIIKKIAAEFPNKIIFEEKGVCDKIRHSQLRQEMLERTQTEWFMVLDGDEVWTKRGIEEAVDTINKNKEKINCVIVDVYLCTGDIFHDHNRKLVAKINGVTNLAMSRFYKVRPGMQWVGEFGEKLVDANKKYVWDDPAVCLTLKNKFWHFTHLQRSTQDDLDYTSNSNTETRKNKRRKTYFVIGTKINEAVPEVFGEDFKKANRLGWFKSFLNFWPYFFKTVVKKLKQA